VLLPNSVLVTALSGDDVTRGATVAVVTVAVVLALLLLVGIVLLFRRRSGAQPSSASGMPALRTRATTLLVRADETLASADDELGFAVAQFGEQRTAAFAATLAGARAKLTEAFRLQQALDDAVPESVQRRREWTLQIVALCESAIDAVSGHDRDFSSLRSAEADSPARIRALETRVADARARLEPAAATLRRLGDTYDTALVTPVADRVEQAAADLDDAESTLADAATRLSPSGVNTVAAMLDDAEGRLRRATTALDAVGRRSADLDAAASALDDLLASSLDDVAEARRQRDSAPDPDSGAAIIEAIAEVESARSRVTAADGRRNPLTALDELSAAVSSLDAASAGARNQAQRLEHARAALVGTLVSARSQVSSLRSLVSSSGRGVGARARTRLAAAERQLEIAEAEADPVEALDAARRAVTHARDADALAHYDAMQRGR
jgi:chromosome segregation ATPase